MLSFYKRHLDMPMPGMLNMSSGSWKDLIPSFSLSLLLHIALAVLVLGFSLPLGISLGVRRSRLHSFIQTFNVLAIILVFIIGWTESSQPKPLEKRHENHGSVVGLSAHLYTGILILFMIAWQAVSGIYRKFYKSTSNSFKLLHSLFGKSFYAISYIQLTLGFIVATNDCGSDNLNNCIAHISMGSSFVWYAVFSVIFPLLSLSYSFALYESLIITIWGIINTLFLGLNWTIRE